MKNFRNEKLFCSFFAFFLQNLLFRSKAEEYFDGSFGINHSDDQKPERILLKVYGSQVGYVRFATRLHGMCRIFAKNLRRQAAPQQSEKSRLHSVCTVFAAEKK